MRKSMTALAAVFMFTACDGNPFVTEDTTAETTDTTTTDTTTGVTSDRTLPPGTTSPTATSGIVRFEAEDGTGNGFAQSYSYNSTSDTFTVDNLPFDGDNTYNRDALVGSLGPYAVYENTTPILDPVNGSPITQFQNKALYGVSTSGQTEFAVVRTGSYVNYGFGGFVYQRNGDVTLPTTGQAIFTGNYAALRDFEGAGGLNYVTGDMNIAIDFEDFNSGSGVRGEVNNRRIFDATGADITAGEIARYNATGNSSITALPTMRFVIEPNVADANGEIVGNINSFITDNNGNVVEFETGNYYAIVSGTNANEIVGIIVTTSNIGTTVTARDTGGFILYR
ncbi:MAG: hypothetical protein AAGP08_12375 [Pseudomonadota bacterium]